MKKKVDKSWNDVILRELAREFELFIWRNLGAYEP